MCASGNLDARRPRRRLAAFSLSTFSAGVSVGVAGFIGLVGAWLSCGPGGPVSAPSVNRARCGESGVVAPGGECRRCPPGSAPSGTRCVPGLQRIPDPRSPGQTVAVATLGAPWHPDPDDDGVPSSRDGCPHHHGAARSADACERDASAVADGDPIALAVEHVSPYGAWFSFVSPRSSSHRWEAGVAWSTDRDSVTTREGIGRAVEGGAASLFSVQADLGQRHGPVVVTAMEPETTYYVVGFHRDYQDHVLDVGEVVEITTLARPRLDVSRSRPNLWLTAAQVETLQARRGAGDGVWRRYEDELGRLVRNAVTPGQRVYLPHSYCAPAALLYAVTQKLEYRAAAATLLGTLIDRFETSAPGGAYRDEGAELALCVDLLWSEIDAATRERAVAAFVRHDARAAADPRNSRLTGSADYAAITETMLINGLLACGGEGLPSELRDQGCAHLDAAMRRWFGVQLVMARRGRGMFGVGGGYLPAGVDDGQVTAARWARSFLVLDHAGVSIGAYREFLRDLLTSQWVHPLTPRLEGFAPLGDAAGFYRRAEDGRPAGPIGEVDSLPLTAEQVPALALLAGALERSGMADEAAWARWLIGRYESTFDASRLANLIYEHAGVAPRDPRADLPVGHLAAGFGVLFDRTSWREDASLLMVRAGWTGVDHNHGDAGHFQLYRRGRWITHEALGRGGVAAEADAHNVLALEGATRQGTRVGQYTADAASSAIAGVIRASHHVGHTFVVADTTGAYRSPVHKSFNYSAVQRSLVWLKAERPGAPDTLVVFDRADRDREIHSAPRLLFHFDAPPAIAGTRATLELPGAGGGVAQRVELHALHPRGARLATLPPDGEPDAYPASLYTHRVVVELPDDAPALRALTVLTAGDAGSDELAAPRVIASDDVAAVLTGDDLVVFPLRALATIPLATIAGGDAPITESSITVAIPASGRLRVWWSGFDPGAKLRVAADRRGRDLRLRVGPGSGQRADSGGLIAVTVSGDSTVTATYRSRDRRPR